MVVAFSVPGYRMLAATLAVEVVAGFSLILLSLDIDPDD